MIKMRRMKAPRRHQTLWSQGSGGDMVGEMGGEEMGWMMSRCVIVGVMVRVWESRWPSRLGLLQNGVSEGGGSGVEVTFGNNFGEGTPGL